MNSDYENVIARSVSDEAISKRDCHAFGSQGGRKGSHLNRLSENANFPKFTHNNKGNTVAKVKMDDIIMSKNEKHKPKPHQATQSIL